LAPKDTRSTPEQILREALGETADLPCFLVWRLIERDGRSDKIPCSTTGSMSGDNSAAARAVLTLEEAFEAAERLGDSYGVGIAPGEQDQLIFGDIDDCVGPDGSVATWAQDLLGWTYAETSPSGRGVRLIMTATEARLPQSGAERGGVGLYGPDCGRFVTVTGHRLPDAPSEAREMPPQAVAAWEGRWKEAAAQSTASLDYRGSAGERAAIADIQSGAALHEPLMFLSSHWARSGAMSEAECLSALDALMEESAAKGTARWDDRRSQIPRWVSGAFRKFANPWTRMSEQQREGLRGLAQETIRRLQAQADEAAARVKDKQEGGGHRLQPLFGAAWGEVPFTHAELEAMEHEDPALLLEIARALRPPTILPDADRLRLEEELIGDAVKLEQTREAEAQRERLQAEEAEVQQQDWQIVERLPMGPFRDLVEHALATMITERPEMAMAATLSAVSVLTTGYIVETPGYITPLTIWATTLAPSGQGKSGVEAFIQMCIRHHGLNTTNMPNSAEGIHREFLIAVEDDNCPSDGMGGRSPTVVAAIDELGYWLGQAGGKSNSTKPGALGFGLSLYNRSVGELGFVKRAARADARSVRERVDNPAFVITGFSTGSTYLPTLSEEMLQNGWANRCLHFISEYDLPPRDVFYARPKGLPPSLATIVEEIARGCWALRWPTGEGFLQDAPHNRRQRIVVPSREGLQGMRDGWLALQEELKATGASPVLSARYEENVLKVSGMMAVIRIAGEAAVLEDWPTGALQISDDEMAYARWLVAHLIRRFAAVVQDQAGGVVDQQNANKIEKLIRESIRNPYGRKNAKRPHWNAALKAGFVPDTYIRDHVRLNRKAMDDAMAILIGRGVLETAEEKEVSAVVPRFGSKRGPAAVYYRFLD
jgi:hypothetical protein